MKIKLGHLRKFIREAVAETQGVDDRDEIGYPEEDEDDFHDEYDRPDEDEINYFPPDFHDEDEEMY